MTVDDFWSVLVKTESGCWEWPRYRGRGGYGVLRWNKDLIHTHRLAYMLTTGEALPKRQKGGNTPVIMHLCDNPPCCNPAHLQKGTYQENRLDCVAKDRHAVLAGDASPSRRFPEKVRKGSAVKHLAKLKEADIPAIRARLAAGHLLKAIAKDYGVGPTNIAWIRDGKTWRHVA